jgi:uncharacterized protein
MSEPDFEQAKRYALERLARELSPHLRYHSLAHTRDDVVPAAERLATMERVTGEALLLLRTAAYYHDIGCIVQRQEHEAIGAGIVFVTLPRFGYTPEHVRGVVGLIMATRLPQTPHNRPEEILADADLDALGREDFFTRSADLRAEWEAQGQSVSEQEWWRQQIAFLEAHHYFTASARALREAKKQSNLAAVRARLTPPV